MINYAYSKQNYSYNQKQFIVKNVIICKIGFNVSN